MIRSKLRHVVLLGFKATASPQNVRSVEEAFSRLESQVEGVNALEWGTNVSPENHARGFTHCFLLTFVSEADRDAYLTHPAHLAFGKVLEPHLEQVCVIDYWTS